MSEVDKDRLIEELREAVRARDEFVAIAAHELRNPMTPILIQVDTLLSAVRHPERCRPELLGPRLEVLASAVRDFVRRSTVLLDVSRIASGNVRIEPADIDVSAVVGGVIDRAEAAARMARCELDVQVPEGVTAILDRLALEQIVENLLSNAIKFGAGKPVSVILSAGRQSLSLAIRDHGIGISEADRRRVFGRFERAVTRREHGGFGIGLWLAHQLALAMQGGIAIENPQGGGARFVVTLPRSGCMQQETCVA